MILYFSGTGNSAYAAKRIGREIQDEALDLFDKIRNHDHSALSSKRPWVVAAPTYAWRIPRVVSDWLMKTELEGARDIYFVLTCGGGIGNAGAYLKRLSEAKGLRYRGCAEVRMPENYIALYDAPGREEALALIDKAEAPISAIARRIGEGAVLPGPSATFKDKIQSGLVNDVFYPVVVHASKFRVTGACISCGKCEAVCPLSNIRMENGRPRWGKRCTHCMACICRCPKEAIEYGKHSEGQPRYVCPKTVESPVYKNSEAAQ
ncbi:flavodoxin [Eubacterium sp. AM05-23]|uniref:EFR1 family ferrodoxin n=1 Tax=Eubacterium TaxID=1730 RepID=UPI000E504C7C|nr:MULTISPECIES: EFR1 family ferrodoxin [Eubacterium]RHO59444.1 flavodoxin [Eubacterium sp. AM05-23]